MIKPIPLPQWQTPKAQQWVAQQLGLPYHDNMQDWPWEVANPEGLEDYFCLYDRAENAERVVIMEMILDAATWQPTPEKLASAWLRIKGLLEQNADLHASTAQYWCTWDYNEQGVKEDGFPITPFVREWWVANYPVPNDSNNLPLTPP